MEPNSLDLSRELAVLAEALSKLGEQFLLAASNLHHPGALPGQDLIDEVAGRRLEFASLRERVERQAEAFGVGGPHEGDLGSVEGLSRLTKALESEQERRGRITASRRRAGDVLGVVQRLAYSGPEPLPALEVCQASAHALAAELAAGDDGSEVSPEVSGLVDGGHPLTWFLRFIECREELADDDWAESYDRVAAAFGKELAAAVARSRVTLPSASPPDSGGDADAGRHLSDPGASGAFSAAGADVAQAVGR